MANQDRIDQLNQALEAMFAERLRDLPDEHFKFRLKEKLMQAAANQTGYIREGFHSIMPYLISAGAARLIEFMKQAFDAEEAFRMPAPEGSIMHAEVRIDDSPIELSDGNAQYPPSPTCLHIYVPDADAVYSRALAAGATSLFEPADRPYGDREAGIKDPSGNHWYIATHKKRAGSHRPEGLRAVTLYLHPKGTSELIQFLETAFDAERVFSHPNADGTIAHASVRIGDSFIEMGEAHSEWQPMPASIHLYVPDADAVYARALQAGAQVINPVIDQPYGERSGGVLDAWGNRWWIATYTGKVEGKA
jgi:uncharacterized glyoxalase superfamily protein PhnB